MTPRDVLATAVAPMAWGTTYAVTTELLPTGRPLTAAALRALPVGLVLVTAGRVLPRRAWWPKVFVLSFLNFAAFFALLFVAAYRLPGGVAATVGAVQPLVVVLLAAALLRERLTLPRIAAAAVGIAGVALIALDPDARLDPIGIAAAVGGALSMASGSVLVQRWGRPVPPSTFAGWQLLTGGLILAPAALLVEGVPPSIRTEHVVGYAYLAIIGGALAYTLWFRGVVLIGASKATFLALLTPVVATAVSLTLGFDLSARQVIGIVAVLAGVVFAQRTPIVTESPAVAEVVAGGALPLSAPGARRAS